MYLDANILDKQAQVDETQAETTIQASEALSEENTNQEVDQDLSESQAESDLFEKFRKNPSFVVDESPRRPGSFEVYMKVGTTGTKEANNLKYYYKKIGRVNGKLTNNSFDLNLLLNHYQIRDYFNPKRLSIPVKDSDFSGNRVSLHNITISTFLVNAYDDARTEAQNREAIENAINQQIEYLQTLPENANKSVQQIRNETRSKLNVENVLNQINEVSLYDSRNMDRIGLKHFKVLSRAISSDRRTVSFELEALPQNQQITYNKFDAPLEVLKTVKKSGLSKEEKIAYINSIPGVKNITSLAADQMTDAQIDVEFDRATEIDESKEIDKVLKDKSCN
jgi:antitoxin component HigA of HigAB toxin-antitoxin module